MNRLELHVDVRRHPAMGKVLLCGSIIISVGMACTPDRSRGAGSSQSASAAVGAAPEAGSIDLELRLLLKGPPKVRAGTAIPLELQLVNRSPSLPCWLGGSTTPPVARITARSDEHGTWVDVPRTPVDTLCGPAPFSWTTPVNPIGPGETWTFEDEFSATTARCPGQPVKFIGFDFPHPGRARLLAHYVHSGQTHEKGRFGSRPLPPFELVSTPLEVEVIQ